MLNRNFNQMYNKILISEGILSSDKKSIETIIDRSKYFVASFTSILKFLKKHVKPEWLAKVINEERQNLVFKLNDVYQSPEFNKKVLKNERVLTGVKLIKKRFDEIWPKFKKLNLLKGKFTKDAIKDDIATLTSTLPALGDILVKIFNIIGVLFKFLKDSPVAKGLTDAISPKENTEANSKTTTPEPELS